MDHLTALGLSFHKLSHAIIPVLSTLWAILKTKGKYVQKRCQNLMQTS